MQNYVRKPQPPRRDNLGNVGWRWFWRGIGVWSIVAVVLVALLAGNVAPLYREARHLAVGLATASAAPPATDDFVPIAHTSGNLFGLNTFLYQEVEEEKVQRSLAMIKEAGFGFIREQVAWQEFERGGKGNYWDERWQRSTWDSLDRLVRQVEASGVEMIVRVDYPPDWALPPGTTWHASPPERFEDYGDFLYSLAGRYRGRLKYYQIWNEPNLTIEWGMRNVDPAEYVRLLKVAYTRVKEADPEAVVIAAALAPTIEKGPANMNDLLFLRRMYEAGAKGYFDIASVNPYGLRSGPDDRRLSDDDTNFSRPVRARQIMVEFGDGATPIWASETGWNALPADYPREPLYGRTTAEQQARYTQRAYERVQREWPWLGMMSLWHFRMVDSRLATQQPYYFGVVGDNFAPRPVFDAMKAMANRPAAVYPGFRQEDHRALVYEGPWRVVKDGAAALGRYAETDDPEAKVHFRFWGSSIDLVVARGSAGGVAVVKVDGTTHAANLLPRDADGRAVFDLRSASEERQVRVPVATRLPLGEHELEVTLADQGRLALDGVVVQAQQEAPPAPGRLVVALALGIGLFLVLARRGQGTDR